MFVLVVAGCGLIKDLCTLYVRLFVCVFFYKFRPIPSKNLNCIANEQKSRFSKYIYILLQLIIQCICKTHFKTHKWTETRKCMNRGKLQNICHLYTQYYTNTRFILNSYILLCTQLLRLQTSDDCLTIISTPLVPFNYQIAHGGLLTF